MSKKKAKESRAEQIQEETIEAISKSEEYLRRNRKVILIVAIAIVVIIGGILAYHNLYAKPRQANAKEAMYKAEHYFGVDSFALALNGNGADIQGFLEIIDKYKGTSSANLAQAYAGISYYHLGQYEEAIKHLNKFKSKDIMVAPSVYGLIGDCYVDLGEVAKGIKYFEDAAKNADNDVLSPIYLLKAGIAYESLGDKEKARASYQQILDKYYRSSSVAEAKKLLAALDYE